MDIATENPVEFWKQYEAATGEKVLAQDLGCYLSGWEGFNPRIWGLLIATSGGFRFHHFPHEGWMSTFTRLAGPGGGKKPEEKTLFIPRSRIISVELIRPRTWLGRIFSLRPPMLAVHFFNEDGGLRELLFESESSAIALVDALSGAGSGGGAPAATV